VESRREKIKDPVLGRRIDPFSVPYRPILTPATAGGVVDIIVVGALIIVTDGAAAPIFLF
jgi:hypothetical protein